MFARKRLYVDGLWVARSACDALDASLNWIDVGALAAQAGCGHPSNACYFGVCDPEDAASEAPMRALEQALESQGVTCMIRREPAPPSECLRCGHGWEHYPAGMLALDLALAVAEEAASDSIDHAVVLSDAHTVRRLQDLFARRYPGKQVTQFTPSAGNLQSARLGRAVPIGRGTTLLRPGSWTPPRRNRIGQPHLADLR
jgi:hypothetical protein